MFGKPLNWGFFIGAYMIDLQQGDCLKLISKLPNNSIDLVLTDPPYCNTHQSWDKMLDWPVLWQELRRVCKENAAKVFFSVNAFTIDLCTSNRKEYRYRYCWEKTFPTNVYNCKRMPLRKYEEICVFYQKQCTYNPQMGEGPAYNQKPRIDRQSIWGATNPNWSGGVTKEECEKAGIALDGHEQYHHLVIKPRRENITSRYPLDILKSKPVHNFSKKRLHPNQKPVELLEFLIKTYTNEGETVLDFTMGSGSTGEACINTGRNFIGMELDPDMFTVAKGRLDALLDMSASA